MRFSRLYLLLMLSSFCRPLIVFQICLSGYTLVEIYMLQYLQGFVYIERDIYNSRNLIWSYTSGHDVEERTTIYNSRNLIWSYTAEALVLFAGFIYNSRNLIWSYTSIDMRLLTYVIYNSRNLIWSYTCISSVFVPAIDLQ